MVGQLPLIYFNEITASLETNDFVEGLLTNNGLSVIYGEAGCGKTFFSTDLALHVALGRGWREREVDGGGVIYIAAEGGHSVLNRIAAFKKHHGISDEDVPFAVVPCPLNLRDPDADTEELIKLIKEAGDKLQVLVKYVVVDTLSRAMAGGNENGPEDMGALVANADRVRDATNAHFCFVHHTGKDASKGSRGHSLLRAASDTEIEITRDVSGVATAKVTKQRDLETAGEFCFRLQRVELGDNDRGKPVTSCVVQHLEDHEIGVSRTKLTPLEQRGLDELRNCVISAPQKHPGFMDIPTNVTLTHTALFRERLKSAGVTSCDNPGSERKQFQRILTQLRNKGVARQWNECIWECVTDRDRT